MIYDDATGLLKRVVVSDDYADHAAIAAAHKAPGEGLEPVAADVFGRSTPDELQAMVDQKTGKVTPPFKLHAVLDVDGTVLKTAMARSLVEPGKQVVTDFDCGPGDKIVNGAVQKKPMSAEEQKQAADFAALIDAKNKK